MTEPGAGAPRASRPSPDHAADALAAVFDNAAALARAEVRLAAAEARAWLARIGVGLVALWLALLLLQVFVLVLALSPVLVDKTSWATLGCVVALALAPAAIMSFVAARELRRMKDVRHGDLDQREFQRH